MTYGSQLTHSVYQRDSQIRNIVLRDLGDPLDNWTFRPFIENQGLRDPNLLPPVLPLPCIIHVLLSCQLPSGNNRAEQHTYNSNATIAASAIKNSNKDLLHLTSPHPTQRVYPQLLSNLSQLREKQNVTKLLYSFAGERIWEHLTPLTEGQKNAILEKHHKSIALWLPYFIYKIFSFTESEQFLSHDV